MQVSVCERESIESSPERDTIRNKNDIFITINSTYLPLFGRLELYLYNRALYMGFSDSTSLHPYCFHMGIIANERDLAHIPIYCPVSSEILDWHSVTCYVFINLKVCLGLEFLNSNKSVELSQILDNVQRLYVPMTNVDSEQKILEKSYSTVTSLMTSLQRNAPGMISRPMQWQTQKLIVLKD